MPWPMQYHFTTEIFYDCATMSYVNKAKRECFGNQITTELQHFSRKKVSNTLLEDEKMWQCDDTRN